MSKVTLTAEESGLRVLTLNNPDKRNIIDRKMRHETCSARSTPYAMTRSGRAHRMNPAGRRINEVERACADLPRDGLPVTFAAVATHTGTARSTLYRITALRALVEHHQRAPDGPLTPITDEIATLRSAVTTLAEQVRRHEQQLHRLQS